MLLARFLSPHGNPCVIWPQGMESQGILETQELSGQALKEKDRMRGCTLSVIRYLALSQRKRRRKRVRNWESAIPDLLTGAGLLAKVPYKCLLLQGKKPALAEGVGFEPTIRLRVCRFSRPVYSTTLAPLRIRKPNVLSHPKAKDNTQIAHFSCHSPGETADNRYQIRTCIAMKKRLPALCPSRHGLRKYA
jgi:hypothetical protein